MEVQEYEDRFGEQEQSEARVVNVSDEPVKFEIAQQAGSRPRRYALAPYGSQGDSVNLQIGYTMPFRGAGRGMVTATIETLTEREIVTEIPPTMGSNGAVIDGGRRPVRVAFVCHEDRAPEMRERYLKAMAIVGVRTRSDRTASARPAMAPARDTATRSARGSAPIVREDAEDQGGVLDEPPPDDDLPPMVAAATAAPEPVTIPKRGGKG